LHNFCRFFFKLYANVQILSIFYDHIKIVFLEEEGVNQIMMQKLARYPLNLAASSQLKQF